MTAAEALRVRALAGEIAATRRDGVKALLPVASVIALRKDSVSLPAPADILDRLAAESDYVITAMAD